MIVKGEKVVLRDKRLQDAKEDYQWRTDAELARFDATLPISTPFRSFLESYTEELRWPSRWQQRFAIETEDGKHIGNCMYYDIDERKKQAELGILIGDRDFWDQGYGEDALNTLVQYIFTTTELKRLYLRTLDWNIRAQKCFQKCGFVPCDRIDRGGKRFVIMELWRNLVADKSSEVSSDKDATP